MKTFMNGRNKDSYNPFVHNSQKKKNKDTILKFGLNSKFMKNL